jgi:hypothetical protein
MSFLTLDEIIGITETDKNNFDNEGEHINDSIIQFKNDKITFEFKNKDICFGIPNFEYNEDLVNKIIQIKDFSETNFLLDDKISDDFLKSIQNKDDYKLPDNLNIISILDLKVYIILNFYYKKQNNSECFLSLFIINQIKKYVKYDNEAKTKDFENKSDYLKLFNNNYSNSYFIKNPNPIPNNTFMTDNQSDGNDIYLVDESTPFFKITTKKNVYITDEQKSKLDSNELKRQIELAKVLGNKTLTSGVNEIKGGKIRKTRHKYRTKKTRRHRRKSVRRNRRR